MRGEPPAAQARDAPSPAIKGHRPENQSGQGSNSGFFGGQLREHRGCNRDRRQPPSGPEYRFDRRAGKRSPQSAPVSALPQGDRAHTDPAPPPGPDGDPDSASPQPVVSP